MRRGRPKKVKEKQRETLKNKQENAFFRGKNRIFRVKQRKERNKKKKKLKKTTKNGKKKKQETAKGCF